MGVEGKPISDKLFNGGLLVEIVSKIHLIKKKAAHQCLSDDIIINSEIKAGKWKDLYIPESDIQSDDLKEIVSENYDLEDHIIDRLEFSYKQKNQKQR